MIFRLWRNFRRKKIKQRPFSQAWLEIINRQVPYYQYLSEKDKLKLLGHIQVFLDEKEFQAYGGLKISDEMRVVVAAQACILLLHNPADYFPNLSTILIYPHSFVAETQTILPGGVVSTTTDVRDGESWNFGHIVLAWDSVLQGAKNTHDGQNLVLHEFAHQLDEQNGLSNGTPELKSKSRYAAWARVLSTDFYKLIKDAEAGHETILDTYGATNPAEFFAVATEAFFEKPTQLKMKHSELYEQLKLYYKQDPVTFKGL